MTPAPMPIQGPKVLIVGANWLGDTLFLTPAIRALKKHYPDWHLACAVPARCAALLEHNPYVNETVIWDDRISFSRPIKFFRIWKALRKRRFDSVIFFHRSRTKAWIARLAGIPGRIGYETSFRRRGLTHVVPCPKGCLHRMDIFLHLVQSLGVPLDGRSCDFFTRSEAAGELRRLLSAKKLRLEDPYVVVHAGGNWDLKRWPEDYFVEWIRLFLEKYALNVVLCGTAPERPICEKIVSHFGNNRVVSLCGETSLGALALLLKHAKLLLSNDSGPLHLAASQRTKIVGLFGPTSPEETGPVSEAPMRILRKDSGCEIPCYFRSCRQRVCMEWLKPEEVFTKTVELLG